MGYFTTNIPAWGNLFPPAPFDKLVTCKGIKRVGKFQNSPINVSFEFSSQFVTSNNWQSFNFFSDAELQKTDCWFDI